MKPSIRDRRLGLASPLNYAAIQSGKIKSPSKKGGRAGCKSPRPGSREGRGENFFLDILFNRMSVKGDVSTVVRRWYGWPLPSVVDSYSYVHYILDANAVAVGDSAF